MTAVPRLVVSGVSSGVGKTSVACGVISALRGAGMRVQAFKVGPDYIDTGYLAEASGRAAANLDTWMMGRGGVESEHDAAVAGAGADVSVIEGVMGYYDGSGDAGLHSTYHVARALGAPVVLVVDASRTGHSVGAAAAGFKGYRRGANIAGVVLNRIGSERHEAMCRGALARSGIAVLGAVPRDPSLSVGSGRLGLVRAQQAGGRRAVARIARSVGRRLDAGALLGAARAAAGGGRSGAAAAAASGAAAAGGGRSGTGKKARGRGGPVVCIARDEAFSFYYHNSLENLRRAGARLCFFSPVSDRRLPAECDLLYIGGGFPEDCAGALAGNSSARRSIKRFADAGGLVHAEGGGAAYLAGSLEYAERSHAMSGVLDCSAAMTGRLRLGYVGARAASGCAMARGGAHVNGHAFHHMEMRDMGRGASFAYEVRSGPAMREARRGGAVQRVDGLTAGNAVASFMQTWIGPGAARRAVAAAARSARK